MSQRPSKLRVGIVSAAWGAKAHLPAWRNLEGVEARRWIDIRDR